MYAAKRFYDNANLPLPSGTNPAALPFHRNMTAANQPIGMAPGMQGTNSVPLGNRLGQVADAEMNSNQVQIGFGVNVGVNRPWDGQAPSSVQMRDVPNCPFLPKANLNVNDLTDTRADIACINPASPNLKPLPPPSQKPSQYFGPFIHPSRRALVESYPQTTSPSNSDHMPIQSNTTKFSAKPIPVEELFARLAVTNTSKSYTSSMGDKADVNTCSDGENRPSSYTLWWDSEEDQHPEDHTISALVAKAKHTCDNPDTQDARKSGRRAAIKKHARKKGLHLASMKLANS
ncbi:hypothetical protein K3495_g4547 [Podosphaera aphanis]|nr:hypothetical protein K3495_g4547 [Podosphaera aphanis]